MIKKISIIVLVITLNLVMLNGCIEQSDKNSNNDISLDKLRLNLDDLYEGGYNEFGEIHETSPYIAQNGTIFEGWLIQEKYELGFRINLSSFILQTLGRLTSEEKADEFINNIKTVNLSNNYNFTEVISETIGEKSYLCKNITYIDDNKIQLYFLSFKIKNIVVALIGSYISKDVIIDYAKIIEKNINDNIS
jgi:hypothetical protein